MNATYEIKTVRSTNEKKDFHSLPSQIYAAYPEWIEAPHADIETLFKEEKYPIERWVVYRNSLPAGRIVAFTHSKLRVGTKDEINGGIGFFECIADREAAQLLFNTAEAWLKTFCVEKVYGPIHPAEKDSYWGLLVEGFDKSPGFRKNFHARHYQYLFEQNGYGEEYKQYSYTRSLENDASEAMLKRISENENTKKYTFSSIKDIPAQTYQNHIMHVYNESWGKIPGFKLVTPEQNKKNFKKLKPIMDKDLIWLAFENEQPVGFAIFTPEVAEHVKDFNGKWSFLHQLKLFFRLKMRPTKKVIGLGFGIMPGHHGSGLAQLLVKTAGQYIRNDKKVEEIELNWIGSFNQKMMALAESFDAIKSKTHITFGKNISEAL